MMQEQRDRAEHRAERDREIADLDTEREALDRLEQIAGRDLPAPDRERDHDQHEQRANDAGGEPSEQAEAARIDPELARKLSSTRGIGRHGALNRCVGDDQQQIERRDQRERKHDAARGKRGESRKPGEQRAHDARDDDPGEQPHAGDTPRLVLDIALAHQQMNQQARNREREQHAQCGVDRVGSADRAMHGAQDHEGAEQPPAPDQVRGQPLRAGIVELHLPPARDRRAQARWSLPRARAPRSAVPKMRPEISRS